jgi:hypothetical protein
VETETPAFEAVDSAVPIPPAVILLLGQTRRWVQLLFVLSLAWLVVIVGALAVLSWRDVFAKAPTHASQLPAGTAISLLIGIVASTRLWPFARSLQRVEQDRSSDTLKEALAIQKSFWKSMGILVATYSAIVLFFLLRGILR